MIEKPPLAPPPRTLPASLGYRVLFGGALPVIGWSLIAIGGVVATVSIRNSELVTGNRFATELATTDGFVTHPDGTHPRVNGLEVKSVEFRYSVDGRTLRGRSFCSERAPNDGARVLVEYALDNPEVARIKGMQSAPFTALAGLILLVPGVGAVLVLLGYRKGKRRLHLMQHGDSAWAMLTDRHVTDTEIGEHTVYELTFVFVDERGEKRTVIDRSHRSEFFDQKVARHVLSDRATGDGCAVEMLPGRPQIQNGEWQPVTSAQLARVYALPAVTLPMLYAANQITV